MNVSSIKYLILFTAIIFLSLSSCSPSYLKNYLKIENSNIEKPTVFNSNFEKATYKTNLKVMGKELSGILLIKKTEEEEFRFVFISEIGLKYFDLGINYSNEKQKFTTHYLMSALKRGEIKNILFHDFSKLLSSNTTTSLPSFYRQNETGIVAIKFNDLESIYLLDTDNRNINKVLWKNNITGKSEISLSKYHNSAPQRVEISNKKYGVRFIMNEIIHD